MAKGDDLQQRSDVRLGSHLQLLHDVLPAAADASAPADAASSADATTNPRSANASTAPTAAAASGSNTRSSYARTTNPGATDTEADAPTETSVQHLSASFLCGRHYMRVGHECARLCHTMLGYVHQQSQRLPSRVPLLHVQPTVVDMLHGVQAYHR